MTQLKKLTLNCRLSTIDYLTRKVRPYIPFTAPFFVILGYYSHLLSPVNRHREMEVQK